MMGGFREACGWLWGRHVRNCILRVTQHRWWHTTQLDNTTHKQIEISVGEFQFNEPRDGAHLRSSTLGPWVTHVTSFDWLRGLAATPCPGTRIQHLMTAVGPASDPRTQSQAIAPNDLLSYVLVPSTPPCLAAWSWKVSANCPSRTNRAGFGLGQRSRCALGLHDCVACSLHRTWIAWACCVS